MPCRGAGEPLQVIERPSALTSKKMALITSDYGMVRSLSIKWP